MAQIDPGHMTDAQARNLAIKSLRIARANYRQADTVGEMVERELDRLIKRKTRINSSSFRTVDALYKRYWKAVEAVSGPLADAFSVAAQF